MVIMVGRKAKRILTCLCTDLPRLVHSILIIRGKEDMILSNYLILREKNILPPNFGLKYFLINGARALPWRQFSYFQEWAMNKRPSAKKIGFRFQDKLLLQKTGHGEWFYISVLLKLWKATESIQLVFALQWSWFSHSIIFHTTKNNEHHKKKPALHTWQTIYHLALHSIVYSLHHIHQRRL